MEPGFRYLSKRHILTALTVAAVYFVLLVPMQKLFSILPGTEVRPAAFLPIVAGIYLGPPAAVGIFLGNMLGDLVAFGTLNQALLLGCAANFFYAYMPYKLWHTFGLKQMRKGIYIIDVRSLIKYLLIILYSTALISGIVSLALENLAGIPVRTYVLILFLNNFEFSIILGIPALIYLPYTKLKPYEPAPVVRRQMPRWVFGLLALLPVALFMVYVVLFGNAPHRETALALGIIFLLLLLAASTRSITAVPQYLDDDEQIKSSIKIRIFIYFLVTAMILALVMGIVIYYIYRRVENDLLALWNLTFITVVVTLNIILAGSIALLWVIEEKITTPLYNLAQRSNRAHTAGDELAILESTLDFVAVGADGKARNDNEHKLYIGLNDKDTYTQLLSVEEARKIVGDICLKYVEGYFAAESEGGWVDEHKNVTHEQTLIYTIFGAIDQQIRSIADDVLITLNQNAILIETNAAKREFYYGTLRV